MIGISLPMLETQRWPTLSWSLGAPSGHSAPAGPWIREIQQRCYSGVVMGRIPRWSHRLSLHAISLVVGCTTDAQVGMVDLGMTGPDSSGDGPTGPGTNTETSDPGGTDPECKPLLAMLRDFKADHPDFEAYFGDIATPGLIEPRLGTDGKPVYAGLVANPPQMTGRDQFDQWFTDVSGINIPIQLELSPTSTANGLTFDDPHFFPFDGRGWGDEGYVDHDNLPHNYHFTAEIRTSFVFEPGQFIKLTGDDDFWLFVDGALVIDLGGLHPAQAATANLDDLGLEAGVRYPLDIFHAERRSVDSSFRLETNVACLLAP